MPFESIFTFLFFLFIAVRLYFTRFKYKKSGKTEINAIIKYVAYVPFAAWFAIILLLILPVDTPVKTFDLPANNTLAIVGEGMVVISILLLYWGHKTIGNQWPVVKDMKNYSMVTTGPYKYVRHPIYLSFFLFTIGKSLVFENLLLLWGHTSPLSTNLCHVRLLGVHLSYTVRIALASVLDEDVVPRKWIGISGYELNWSLRGLSAQ